MTNSKIVVLENTFYTVVSLRMDILIHLKAKGFELYILSKGDIKERQKLDELGFHTIDVGSVVLNPIKAIQFIYKLISQIREIQPVKIFSFTIRPNIFGSLVARYLSIPIISNVSGTGPLTSDKSLLYRSIRFLYRFAFQKNQTVFFQNQDDMSYFINQNFVRPTQAKLLPGSGVDTTFYSPRVKTSSEFTFLMISRLIKDKGVIEFIEAARIVKAQKPSIKFQLLGPFWTQSIAKNTITKEEVSSWESEKIIDYLGYTMDIRPFIAETSCIVLPSYREGCANVLMQGASMAKPLIASDVTGCNNLIVDGKNGFLVPLKNANKLAESMLNMFELSSEDLKAFGSYGREKMKCDYEKKIVLESYFKEI